MSLKRKYPNCGHNFGRTRPVAKVKLLGCKMQFFGKDFYFYYMFKTNFSEHSKHFQGFETKKV